MSTTQKMQAIYDKRYREKHKEKLSQKQKERYKKEKEQGITKKYDAAKKKEINRRYYIKHREKMLEKSKLVREVNKMNKKVSITITAEVIDKMRIMSDKEISEMIFEMHNHAVLSTNCKQGTYEIDLEKFNQIERTKF